MVWIRRDYADFPEYTQVLREESRKLRKTLQSLETNAEILLRRAKGIVARSEKLTEKFRQQWPN